jgi:hypothetical protein
VQLEIVRRHTGLPMEVVEEADATDDDPLVGGLEIGGDRVARVHVRAGGADRGFDRTDVRDT